MSLPGTKALWFFDIMELRIDLSLLAKTLEIILYDTLHKLMGRNSLIFVGLFVLGIRTIFVLFRSARDALALRVFKIILGKT